MALHHFVEIGDDLVERNVGQSDAKDGLKALVRFADRRFGREGWTLRKRGGQAVAIAEDVRAVENRAFPVSGARHAG